MIDSTCVGILSLDFPFENSANIYWLGVKKNWHNKGIGKSLLRHAEMICRGRNIYSLSVETLSAKEKDKNYLKTFAFYLKEGFKPLFELNTYGPEYLMTYLNKIISPQIFEWIDLTHEISENAPTWDAECGFKHTNILNYEDCTTDCKFLVQRIETLAGIGTHIDAPAHCFPGGKTVSDLSLETLISPCIVLDLSSEAHADYHITIETIKDFENQHGNIWKETFVIFYTGWDQYWTTPEKYRNDYHFPSVSKEVAQYLVAEEIVGIGVDTLSPDRPESGYPVHQILLSSGKYIVENIANARLLPTIGSYIFAMPLRFAKGTEAPIRLLGMVQKITT
jgi:kynurenine formamidase